MRKFIKYRILGLIIVLAGFVSCDQADQEASPVISTDKYPVATYVTDFSGNTINEGDTIIYTITLDKTFDRPITFSLNQVGGTCDENDYIAPSVTLAAYTFEVEFPIIITMDNLPEINETFEFELGVNSLAERYMLNPISVHPSVDVNITNKNWTGGVTIAFSWTNTNNDFDIFSISALEGDWNDAGTAANPEIMEAIWNEDNDGKYYLTVDPYSFEGTSDDYVISIGYPNQTIEFFEGTFDYVNREDLYNIDYYADWDVNSYRLLEIEKAGTSYTSSEPTVKR